MSIVYGIKPIGKFEEQRDIEECFKRKEAFKINSGSGPFRIFIDRLQLSGEGYNYWGTVSGNQVEGFFCPRTQRGTLVFVQEVKVRT